MIMNHMKHIQPYMLQFQLYHLAKSIVSHFRPSLDLAFLEVSVIHDELHVLC